MPTTDAPTTEAATTEAATTQGLTTESPTTDAPTTEAPPTTQGRKDKVQIPLDDTVIPASQVTVAQVEIVVESSIGMGLSEAEARAIEPATQAALAATLNVSGEAVAITGYKAWTDLGRRLQEAWTDVSFTVEVDEATVESVSAGVREVAAEPAALSEALGREVTVQGLESKLRKPVTSFSITVDQPLVVSKPSKSSWEADAQPTRRPLVESKGSMATLFAVSLLAC